MLVKARKKIKGIVKSTKYARKGDILKVISNPQPDQWGEYVVENLRNGKRFSVKAYKVQLIEN
ncbi:hypothetical protein AB4865_02010 [Capnocytophaga sp. ARDL2]|uniref:hypothetical protein n=1 Tax=Capnocytophaga sp. ARDL2 TaxID=3238809 RepID=UPI0035581667